MIYGLGAIMALWFGGAPIGTLQPVTLRRVEPEQLERAITYIMDELKKHPPTKFQHPPFPVEKLSVVEK